ncbi:MAG: hypothetical protein IJW02_04295 [Clostridia bacterium]|nr:hypothetical protein [Clostridia bacterium]
MRKIFFIGVLLLLSASIVGCDMINKIFPTPKATVGEKSEGERIEKDGAVCTVISSDKTSLQVRIENNTDSTWQSGNMRDYSLEMKKGNEWYTVTQIGELANTMELMIFSPNETLTHTFLFTDRYGQLAPGEYRIVKSFWANKTATEDAHEFYLICEFTVE